MADPTYNQVTPPAPSPDEQEEAINALLQSDDMEKAAAEAPSLEDFAPTTEDRMSEPAPAKIPAMEEEEDKDEEYVAPASHDLAWQAQPSIKDQVKRYPESVRMTEHVTTLLDLSDKDDMKLFNDLQKASHSPDAPTKAILEKDIQKHKGAWTMLLTYANVEYLKM